MPPTILWFRQDLRVSDHPALVAAAAEGAVIPLYILDDEGPGRWAIGGAQRWWLDGSLAALDASLRKRGSRLLLRRGRAAEELAKICGETGSNRIHATRCYEPWWKAADKQVAGAAELVLHDGNYLAAPDSVTNAGGGRYSVYTPWYRKLLERMPPALPLAPPDHIEAPEQWPASESLSDWALKPTNPDWAQGFTGWQPGEKGAWRAARDWMPLAGDYKANRDFPSRPATSRLSPHLHFGELTPRALWHALGERDDPGVACYRSELGWREHGINLVDQMPGYGDWPGRERFGTLAWRYGPEADSDFAAWTRGRTGYPVVDAGMRELWQTGWMHNRVRMIVASFLVKHLLIDWRRGERWFWDTLLDADLGSNAMNWQYVAGTGVDAPVFSRIMSPILQCERFAMGDYVRSFVPEIAHLSDAEIVAAHGQDAAVAGYPAPLIGHQAARARALAVWEGLRD
ncbi:cryptochrome/photolyase family protein [Sphingopyxis sp. RIFCSPHIGHO2_12_FULL_65_19]|uniref:cryptochrome/photolyase family protein n=1 Tax=Sphingopyxis sp. RIFCSPHIGHO2_12_FULL_65_19 TaxID=1802172 RepID=UPI0008CCC547|nr:deoxyribodipyrimidine photo-lyase [Sphingopyxis sp. RIFCSPHIGHO2_12_FULL_65_19]OHD06326.1 MAG: deoxyribodipyrimidine photolyase [Sphingopyxis sp. RIFCSPHIGHO2_12_FULL_65_19]